MDVHPGSVGSGKSDHMGVIIPNGRVWSNLKVNDRDEIHTTSAALKTDLKPIPFSPMCSLLMVLPLFVLWLTAHMAFTFSAVNPTSLQSIRSLPGLYENCKVGVAQV